MNWSHNNLDFSPYACLRRRMLLARALKTAGILSGERYGRLLQVDPQIIRWDLRNGIPFADGTFDAVYHSHFLEHIDRTAAPEFLRECRRVLKPGGILRIVVPDLELAAEKYLVSLVRARDRGVEAEALHDEAVSDLFDQFTRNQTIGSSLQKPMVRFIEQLIRGGAAESGELHRWMYDEHSLRGLLITVGFDRISRREPLSSSIEGWAGYLLDTNDDGTVYKRDSLYVEATK